MPDLGAIGINTETVGSPAVLMGPPWWWNPLNHQIVIRNDAEAGASPAFAAGFLNGRVPADYITVIVADFGQAGGGISIF